MNRFFLMMICVAMASFSMKLHAQNVGIGSTVFTPNYLLHINQNAAAGTLFQMTNTTTGTTSTDGFQITFNTTENTFQLNNRESGNISFFTNNVEKLRITSDSGIMLMNPVDYVYTNFSSIKGNPGYGFRSWNGRMQYKHKGGIWADFPTMPSIPGNVEWWIRPTAALYIRPITNDQIRVWDNGQTYGISYDGGGNLIGGYFRITNSTLGAAAIQGFSDVAGNQTYGYLGYNDNITVGSSTVGGAAVHGRVEDPNRTAVYGRTAGTSDVAAMLGYSNVWIASYNWTDNSAASSGFNPSSIYGHLVNSSDASGAFYENAVFGNSEFTGTGNVAYTVGGYFQGAGNVQDCRGVMGLAFGNTANNVQGGYFYAQGDGTNYSYVADNWNNRKITGTGGVSEIIPTKNHGRITLTCPESPEYWYIDYGTVKMINGKAHIELDPILIDICVIDDNNPIKVICQPNMEYCNGVAVINKTEKGFDIVEMNGGTHSGEIDFQIVAKPKTNYGEGRFPQGPGPDFLKKDMEPLEAKAKNQGNREKMYRWPNDWDVYGYDPEEMTPIGGVIPAGPNAGKIKLGNGKYGTSVPAKKSDLGIGN